MESVLVGESGNGQAASKAAPASGNSSVNGSILNPGSVNAVPGQSSQSQTFDWRASLPDDIRSDSSLSQIQDIPSLAKSYVNAQKLVGKKGIIKPDDKASDEEMNHFYDTLGRPPLEKYEIKLPKEVKINDVLLKEFKENSHKSGLMPKQAEGLLNWWLQKEQQAQIQAKANKELETKAKIDGLKQEWGQGYDAQRNIARQFLGEFADENDLKQLVDSGLANEPFIAKLLAKAGKKFLAEDKLRGDGSGKMGQTPEEIDMEIKTLEGSENYNDPTHPGHGAAKLKMEQLFRAKYPE